MTELHFQQVPLCVDLDGSLIKTDSLWELMLQLIKVSPWQLFLLPCWALRGKVFFKNKIASLVSLNVECLPYNDQLLAYLKEQHATGREIVLCTGSHVSLATKIADHLQLFSKIYATDAETNLIGESKARFLTKCYGEKGFDYVGNEMADIPVWNHCREAILISNSHALTRKLSKSQAVTKVFQGPKISFFALLKAIRVYQWVKNFLIFIPLVLDQRMFDADAVMVTFVAFIVFSLVASATYIINDLLDLESDRLHKKKCNRAFASGLLSVPFALKMFACLIILALLLCLFLPLNFFYLLLLYIVITLAYSFGLKKLPVIDVCILAGLYTLRVIAGSLAISAGFSFWLLAFSIFFFLSLALAKRSSELKNMLKGKKSWAEGRGYHVDDINIVNTMGVSSGYVSVLIIALYINSEKVLSMYDRPEILWIVCPIILYWISRIWLITGRGEMDEDPIVFAIKDKVSWILVISCGLSIALALVLVRLF
jgi:4-hydroxybenzoate polyprenyltransferase